MKNNELTALLEPDARTMNIAFSQGAEAGRICRTAPPFITMALDMWADTRARYGFKHVATPMLTPPSANMKLDKAVTPSYGLTLQHHRTKLRNGLSVNACPNAGHCVKVCVLDNGNGGFPAVQRAREAKTDFLVTQPEAFSALLGWELQRAALKHGAILFRPNVNSDVAWERLLPSLTNGLIHGVTSYGYSKRPEVLDTDGWLGRAYRVAYSWNERSNKLAVRKFIMRGGSVAVVTSRRKGEPVGSVFPFGTTASAMDADLTDEWIMHDSTVGDLSAKGKARRLVGKSKFIVTISNS